MSSTLAIGITYYNEKELLTECLESLQLQTVMPDEVLIYDDNSTFPANDYLPATFPLPIRVIRNPENKKPAFGRNLLIEEAKSIYIHFQDADDLFKPNCIEKIKKKIIETEADFIVNDVESQKNGQIVASKVMNVAELYHTNIVSYGISGSYLVPSITYKKELAKTIGGFRPANILPQSEDYDFHIRLAYVAKSYAIIDETLIIQRLRDNSHSSTNQKQVYTSGLQALQLLKQELSSQYHEVIAQRAVKMGIALYGMKYYSESSIAFKFANSITHNLFPTQTPLYKFLVRLVGIEYTIDISTLYQRIKKLF